MKKILSFPLIILLIFSLSLSVSAGSQGFVDDYVDILTANEAEELNSKIQDITETYSLTICILTVDSLDGMSAQQYADRYYDKNLRTLSSGNGILLMVAKADREWVVTINGETASVITNRDIDNIMDNILSDLSAGNYYWAFCDFLDSVKSEYDNYSGQDSDSWFPRLLIAIAIGLAAAGITIFVMRSKMNTARAQVGAGNYMTDGSFDLYRCRDIYLYSHTSRIRKAENNGSHRGGGGHRGGRSGRF